MAFLLLLCRFGLDFVLGWNRRCRRSYICLLLTCKTSLRGNRWDRIVSSVLSCSLLGIINLICSFGTVCMMVTIRTRILFVEINFATLRALGNFACYFNTAIGTNGCLFANLASAFGTFYHCHNDIIFKGYLCLNLISLKR